MIRQIFTIATIFASVTALAQQTPPARPQLLTRPNRSETQPSREVSPLVIARKISKGTAIEIAVDQDLRIHQVGQPIEGRLTQPLFAFDKEVIPAGARAVGHIVDLEHVGAAKRTLYALNADLSPPRMVQVEFTELALADGTRLQVQTRVVPGSGQVLDLVQAAAPPGRSGKGLLARKQAEAKAEAKRRWNDARQQVATPGKIHRLERLVQTKLPWRPHYVNAGTVYIAELQEPLSFGSETLTAEETTWLSATPPDGSVVHTRLLTALDSAIAKQGDQVDAIVSQPLFDHNHLILPEGTLLSGNVVKAKAASHFKHNGQLGFVFHDIALPDGLSAKLTATLQSVEADKNQRLRMDSEGVTESTNPKTRFLSAAVTVGLAAAAHENESGNRAQGGAAGFKVVGIVLGLAIRSQPLALAMGAYGASRSIYSNFIAKGQEVKFPRQIAMQVSLAAAPSAASAVPSRK